MSEIDEFPFARRALGSALITGASGAGMGLSLARPFVHEGIERAYAAAEEIRRASRATARNGVQAALDGARPAMKEVLDAKDRLRRRAVGNLPPKVGGALEEWRREFIAGEKAAFFGSLRMAEEFRPTFDVARARSRNLLEEAVRAFEDVADVALATSIKFGESIQQGELPSPPRPKPGAGTPRAARREPARKRA